MRRIYTIADDDDHGLMILEIRSEDVQMTSLPDISGASEIALFRRLLVVIALRAAAIEESGHAANH